MMLHTSLVKFQPLIISGTKADLEKEALPRRYYSRNAMCLPTRFQEFPRQIWRLKFMSLWADLPVEW
jgi:hypothetical protein